MLGLLEDALKIDANFAEALSVKSSVLSTIAITQTEVERASGLAEAEESAEQAIRLAPEKGDGYAARAQVRWTRFDWSGADRDFRAAQARGTGSIDFSETQFLMSAGYVAQAHAVLESSVDADPLDRDAQFRLMLTHETLGNRADADAVYQQGQRLFASGAFWLGHAASRWIRLGRDEVGPQFPPLPPIEGMNDLDEWVANPRVGLAALKTLVADPKNQTPVGFAEYAILAAYFDEPEYAVELLGQASGLLMFLTWLPVFDEMRQLPEFKQLLLDIGLVEYWRTNGWPDVCRPTGQSDFVCS